MFRVDASLDIGTGHVMRCLTLANLLVKEKINVYFVCREHKGSLVKTIKDNGFYVYVLPNENLNIENGGLDHAKWLATTQEKDAKQTISAIKKISPDWLIVDHYALDSNWEKKLKPFVNKIMVIDDLGDRKHECDLLLDQNYGASVEKYKKLTKKNSKLLLGTKYSLLRNEFSNNRQYSLKRRKNVSITSILITMGGIDSDNYTSRILDEVEKSSFLNNLEVNIILGNQAPHIKLIKEKLNTLSFKCKLHLDVNNMAELMSEADIAIGASGSTTWERCCLGLPAMQVIIADNQAEIAKALDSIGAIKLINNLNEIPDLLNTAKSWMIKVSKVSASLTDGTGTSLVLKELTS